MAYPFDETFEAGIPAGFGAAGGAGGVTATWAAESQAVDLVFTQALNFWRIAAAPQASDFWFEMDVEIVAAAYTPPFFGIWLWDGVGTHEGHRLIVWNAGWEYSARMANGTAYDAEPGPSAGWAVVGARRTLRLDARRSSQGIWCVALAVDGVATAAFDRRYYASFVPCVFGYGITLRLHRAAGGAPSALADRPLTSRGLPPALARRILLPEHAAARQPTHRALRPLLGTRSHYYHGRGRIRGSVKEKGSQGDLPVSRRVLLIDERANVVVREAWSDAATGAYAFERISLEVRYLVIAFDHQQNFRAVVADRLAAEPMVDREPMAADEPAGDRP